MTMTEFQYWRDKADTFGAYATGSDRVVRRCLRNLAIAKFPYDTPFGRDVEWESYAIAREHTMALVAVAQVSFNMAVGLPLDTQTMHTLRFKE